MAQIHHKEQDHVQKEQPHTKADTFKKWLGLAAGVLSLGSATVGVLKTQSNMTERGHVAVEQLAAGRLQQKVGDYSHAWESFQRAAKAADGDGPIATLLGGSGKEQAQVRQAQEDLAMEWLRNASATEGHPFAEVVDKAVPVLSAAVGGAIGARKADILAHLGWAYYLKQREGDTQVAPLSSFRDAVAADPSNPYANAFWGRYLLWNHGRPWQTGPVPEAQQHFATALGSGRERALVRQLQLAALFGDSSDEAEAAWWQTVDEMRKGGEPVDAHTQREMVKKYFVAPNSDHQIERLLGLVSPAEHVELTRWLLQTGQLDEGDTLAVRANMAIALGAAGRPEEALAAWREVKAAVQLDHSYNFAARMDAALKGARPIRR
jgi:hypothetical protein